MFQDLEREQRADEAEEKRRAAMRAAREDLRRRHEEEAAALYAYNLGVADGMSIARVWTCRDSN